MSGKRQIAWPLAIALVAGVHQVPAGEPSACSESAKYLFNACRSAARSGLWTALAGCRNVADADAGKNCRDGARIGRDEGRRICEAQFEARVEVCTRLGESSYEPDFQPARFVDPLRIGRDIAPNPYFPLIGGTRRVYRVSSAATGDEDAAETVVVTVTRRIKLIQGVSCLAVTDTVFEEGEIVEDTDDWYAQDLEGAVWYCGEISRNFETYEGDRPLEPELVHIRGSWKAGRNGAKPGMLMPAAPRVGDMYRQEMLPGEAEDLAEIVSLVSSEGVPAAKCRNDCLETRDFTPLEPGREERKFYAPGIGLILETNAHGKRLELMEHSRVADGSDVD